MSRKNQYDNDQMFEEPSSGYYFPPMFRFPSEEERGMMDMESPLPGPMTGQVTGPITGDMDEQFPTGLPGGMPSGIELGGTPGMEPPLTNIAYLQAYLKQNIGKSVRVEFLLGDSIMSDKSGILESVGVSYIVLRDFGGNRVVCDLYSIKFVNIFDKGIPR